MSLAHLERLPEEVLEQVILWLREELRDAENAVVEKAATASIDKVRLSAGATEKVRELLRKAEVIYERKRHPEPRS